MSLSMFSSSKVDLKVPFPRCFVGYGWYQGCGETEEFEFLHFGGEVPLVFRDPSWPIHHGLFLSPLKSSQESSFSANLTVSFSWLPIQSLTISCPHLVLPWFLPCPLFLHQVAVFFLPPGCQNCFFFDYRRLCLVFLFLCFGAVWRNNGKGRCKLGKDLADLLYKNGRAASRLPVGIVCHDPRNGNKSSLQENSSAKLKSLL